MPPTFSRPHLDRKFRIDQRNLNFPIRPFVAGTQRRRIEWTMTARLPLNQQTDSGSVGFGWASMMEQVDPVNFPAIEHTISFIAGGAHQDDTLSLKTRQFGCSLLGGARHLKRSGWITNYRWCFTPDDVLDTLCGFGPVLLGVDWYDSMYEPLPDGIVTVNGPHVGGHCLLAVGYIPADDAMKMGLARSPLVRVVPSLGKGYGIGGSAYLRLMDLAFLMNNGGEGVVPDNMRPVERLEGMRAFAARPAIRRITNPFRRD
jgi:hypothetical protein